MLSEGSNHKTYRKQVESFVILALDLFILTLKQLLPGKDSDSRGIYPWHSWVNWIDHFLQADLGEGNFKGGNPEEG